MRILYFAWVRERVGVAEEEVTPPADVADVAALIDWLATRSDGHRAAFADPARLADEAAAISMMGGRRVVRVRGATNNLTDLLEGFLDDPPGDALVVVEAGDIAKFSSLIL